MPRCARRDSVAVDRGSHPLAGRLTADPRRRDVAPRATSARAAAGVAVAGTPVAGGPTVSSRPCSDAVALQGHVLLGWPGPAAPLDLTDRQNRQAKSKYSAARD